MAKNIFLQHTASPLPYASQGGGGGPKYPTRNSPDAHARFISRKLQESRAQDLTQRQVAAIRYKDGLYLEFSGAVQHDLAVQKLENLKKGIRLSNVKRDGDIVRATVYIPAGQETYFLEKVQAYGLPVGDEENPKNNDLVRSIEDVRLAVLDSFWFGDATAMPDENPEWCEIWLRFDRNDSSGAELDFAACCNTLEIELNTRRIIFPERIVRLGKANKEQLKNLISMCACIAEIRRAPNATSFFDNLSGKEQAEWVDELLARTTFHNINTSVCLLDTGLSAEHPLLSPATREEDVQTVESAWRVGDRDGHGTEMAGVALFNDLKDCLSNSENLHILHKLESVKILPPHGENPPELYGAVTEQAVALAEIASPYTERAICMAVTSPEGTTDGSPTSWSGAVDSVTSGAEGSDRKRLFFISAGNVEPTELGAIEYPNANILHCVENPGQSWNALTVGAYTINITSEDEEFSGFSPVADVGDLSPYSSTSVSWNDKWPIKPEILLDGGNVATNGTDYTNCPDLSLLTTNRHPTIRLFSTIWGTSSATAQAAWMAAQLFTEYPGIWPETVRALLVHSSHWTNEMC
ncbi:MAG: S8 family peptidase [Oscillospiraceae bacterium]|nr:S8 family peptidase [Oscillospiraceae bacterium]